MARSDRIQVTVSPAMSIALEVLGDRSGLSRSAQAMVVLRQGLARTMESRTVQERLAQRKAQWTARQWQEDTTTEHAVETAYAAFDEGALLEQAEEERVDRYRRAGAAHAAAAEGRRLGAADALADARVLSADSGAAE